MLPLISTLGTLYLLYREQNLSTMLLAFVMVLGDAAILVMGGM